MTRRITQTNSLLIENVALLAGLLVINKNSSSSSVMSNNQFNPAAAEDPELSMTTVCIIMTDYYYSFFGMILYDCHAARIDRTSRLSSRNPFGYDR